MAFAGMPALCMAAPYCPSRHLVYFPIRTCTLYTHFTPFIIVMAYNGPQYVILSLHRLNCLVFG